MKTPGSREAGSPAQVPQGRVADVPIPRPEPSPPHGSSCHRGLWPTPAPGRGSTLGSLGRKEAGKPEVGGGCRKEGGALSLMWWPGPFRAVARVLGFGWDSNHHKATTISAGVAMPGGSIMRHGPGLVCRSGPAWPEGVGSGNWSFAWG